jgi:hypothetical protein
VEVPLAEVLREGVGCVIVIFPLQIEFQGSRPSPFSKRKDML